MRYKKRPIEVEAIVWNGKNFDEIHSWSNGVVKRDLEYEKNELAFSGMLCIDTNEGKMYAKKGDYIIKEPFDKERKFYPCKPDIFQKTYEQIK